jgi:hypothetical protein
MKDPKIPEILLTLRDEFLDASDIEDGPDGQPAPNEAMSRLQALEEVMERWKALVQQNDAAVEIARNQSRRADEALEEFRVEKARADAAEAARVEWVDAYEATAKERDDALARESRLREALAATLVIAEKVIAEAMAAASVMNLNKAGCLLSAYQLMGRDYAAILSSRDAAQRKAGALWALRLVDGAGIYYASYLIRQIERGEVKP